MNILIVSQHFFPDNFRVNEIAVGLVKMGNSVTVLTSTPDYATGYIPEEYKNKFEDNYFGVNVVRVKTSERKTGIVNRAKNYFSFMINSTKKIKSLNKNFDIVLSYQTSPVLMAHAAIKTKKYFKIPLVLYCLDLWPESLKVWNVGEGNPLFKIMHLYSKWAYNQADRLAVTSEPFKDYLINFNNIDKDKITFLPQHCEPLILEEKEFNKSKIFAFGGNIGAAQDIPTIIKAVNEIKDLDFSVRIYGDGSELENCKQLTSELELNDKIEFFGRVSKDELSNAYNNVDAFLLTLKQNGAVGDTIPAKLQEYMSAGKPIFASVGKGARMVIEEAVCGVVCEPSDHVSLAENMKDFILNTEKYSSFGKNGKNYFYNNFTLDEFLERLSKFFIK